MEFSERINYILKLLDIDFELIVQISQNNFQCAILRINVKIKATL